jgi:hypothetical protein
MRLLTFFAVAALACLACAMQANAGIGAEFAPANRDGASPEASAAITH